MKILLLGRGVISTQYGWAFEKAGNTVEFYVRPGRMAAYGSTITLNILDARKKLRGVPVQEEWTVKMVEDLKADHGYDLIMVSVQHYHFPEVATLLSNKIGHATLLLFNNFWNEPQFQTANLPQESLVWGFPVAGGGFDHNGVLNGTLWGRVIIGTFGTAPSRRTLAVMNLFKLAGFKSKVVTDFRSWLLGHFVMNAAMHLETLKNGLGFRLEDLQTTVFWKNVVANGKEMLPLLKARDVTIKASPDLKIFNLPAWLLSFLMKIAIKFLPSVKHLFTGHSNNNELKSYCRDVLLKSEKMNIKVPRLLEHSDRYL